MKKSLFAILVTLLFLLATDMIFRLIGYRTVNKVFIDRTQLRRTDKVYGCSLVPNSDVGKYRINEQGYREDHFIPSARSDREKIRILALGDSIIFGAEVENNESICCRLESLIAASLEEGDEVEVINTAVMWWGPTQYLSRYELEGSAFNPDCVIIGGCPNDVTDVIAMEKLMASGSVIEHRYYQDLVVGRDPMNESHAGAFALYTIASFLMRHSAFANYLYEGFVEKQYKRLESERLVLLNSMDILELTEPYISKMNELLAKIDEPMIFILFPSINYVRGTFDPIYFPYEKYYHEFTKLVLQKHDVPCIDVTQIYRKYLADNPQFNAETLFAGDLHHPSSRGHGLVAASVYDQLKAYGCLSSE